MTTVTETMLFIEVDTGKYPVYLSTIRAQFQQTISFGGIVPIEDVTGLGFAPVVDSVIPTGVVTEGAPALVDGVWSRTWVSRSFDAAELADQLTSAKQLLCEQITTQRDQEINYGMVYTFADGTTGGVQMRPADRTNLLELRIEAEAYIQAGVTTADITFRSLENVTRLLDATETMALTNASALWGKKIYATSWTLKDQLAAANTLADLPTLPATFG